MKILFIAILSVFLVYGCWLSESPASHSRKVKNNKLAINQCVKTEGVPIMSKWDNELLDHCEYPPK